tara:strand:+ start:1277 stop:2065 length:789 start_codon:yes stop_codon:yes gene_type:complete
VIKYFGIIQGRLVKSENSELQSIPSDWTNEIFIAEEIGLNYIELIAEKNFNKKSPLWDKKKLANYKNIIKKKNLFFYSLCDDYSLMNPFWGKKFLNYFNKIIQSLNLLDIKIYTLPLYEKSDIEKIKTSLFIKSLNLLSKKLNKNGIKLCIESNMSKENFISLSKKIKNKNFYITFDTGNRLLSNDIYKDIKFLKKKIIHIHLKDKNKLDVNVKYGKGLIDLKKLFKTLKIINYNKSLTMETVREKIPHTTAKENLIMIKKF